MIYNSRDPRYKSIYGAVEAGQKMTIRLLLPYDSGAVCYSARMLVTEDSTGEETAYELVGTNSYEDGSRWWELTLSLKEPGLYWYYFEYNTPWSQEQVYKGAFSNGYIRIDPSFWQLTVYEKGYRTPDSLKGATMYQIFPDRFFNSRIPKYHVPSDRDYVGWFSEPRWRPDEHGVVWNNDYFCGDLKGIERKLPYIRNLGVTVIYLNPIFESHTNHRYSTADYSKIDPLLGTEEDFRELCIRAHKFGIKIILDGVFSHTGDDSVYFNKKGRYPTLGAYNSKESPYYSWYNFSEWPDRYDSWWGFDILPNVNETEPAYMDYITGEGGIIEKWLKLGADGWRLDVADELPDEFIEAIHTRAKATKKDAIVLGEVWEDASNKVAYSQRRKYLLGHELDSVMNYPFANAIIDFVADNDAAFFLDKILTITENYPKEIVDVLMNMLGTHDTERIITRLAGEDCTGKDREWQAAHSLSTAQYELGVKLEKIAATIQYTLPGIPSIYYGDEAGMQGYKDPFNRRGFPWTHIDTNLSAWYTWLGFLRKTCPVIPTGQFIPISGASGCVCYARMNETHPVLSPVGDALVVIANRNPHGIDYWLPEELSDVTPVMNVVYHEGRKVTVGPCSAALLGRGDWCQI